ncbi:MAG: SpoIIE family protein phosphatase [Actinobacteria bacterium]|nr:SpoIIE family protein phosphatase [Actinomycetota bacterium]
MFFNQLSRQDEVIIYFFYGLAYFSMGMALVMALRRRSRLSLVYALPWLAGFGIVHGLHEWIDMLTLFPGYEQLESTSLVFVFTVLGTLGVSLGLLFQFGVELIYAIEGRGKALRYIPLFFFSVWLVIVIVLAVVDTPRGIFLGGAAAARYLLYLPGSMAAGIAFYIEYRALVSAGFKNVALYMLPVTVFFLANAFFGGLIVRKTTFWPGSVLNNEAFKRIFGFPVFVIRAIIAVGVATFALLGMRVFDEEDKLLREKRETELKALDYLTNKIIHAARISEIIPEILGDILKTLPAEAGAIFMKRPETDELWLEAAKGLSDKYVARQAETHIRLGEGLIGFIGKECKALFGKVADYNEIKTALDKPSKYESFALIPFATKERCLVILVATVAGQEFSGDDERFLRTVGNQLGITLENALLEEQRRIAQVLQQSLLSPIPYVKGLEIGVRYEPATAGLTVGGDFYDFIELPTDGLGVVIGDVSGKGLNAAALTSSAKNTIRAFLYEDSSPGSALTRANQVLTKTTTSEQFVTVLVVVLKSDYAFTYASAGHPSTLLCDPECRFLRKAQGLPLGAFDDVTYEETEDELKIPGYLVLYTDGLTEARRGPDLFGEERIRLAMGKSYGQSAGKVADIIARSALEFARGKIEDDLAVIALHPRMQA